MDSSGNNLSSETLRPDARQLAFDWNRAAKLRTLERARLSVLPARAMARAKALLRVIESHSRDHVSCWLAIETVVIESGFSESSIHRAVTDCEAAGLLKVVRGKGVSTYSLNWSLLLDLSRETIDEKVWSAMRAAYDGVVAARAGAGLVKKPVHKQVESHTVGVSDNGLRGVRCAQKEAHLTPIIPMNPQMNPATTKQGFNQISTHALQFEFEAVAVALEQEGILAGGQSVLAASAAGASAEFLLELIAFARQTQINGVRAYGPGALMRRIGRARLGQTDSSTLWPVPCAAYQREQERSKQQQREQSQRNAQPVTASVASANASVQRAALEASFGAECDELLPEQILEMAAKDAGLRSALHMVGGDVRSLSLRGMLLKRLAARAELRGDSRRERERVLV